MHILINYINNIFREIFKKLQYNQDYCKVLFSSQESLGQFQSNAAFLLAKELRKNPKDIALLIIEELNKYDELENINFANPGFINISLKDDFILVKLNEYLLEENYKNQKYEQERIVIDYGGPNIAKPLHVGHLRSAIIGESIKRINLLASKEVISDTHLGDWGLQMGLILASFEEKYGELSKLGDGDISNIEITLEKLSQIYPLASKRSKEDLEFFDLANNITLKLQNKEKNYYLLWKKIVDVSLLDIKKIYQELDVNFDYWYGESNASDYVLELINRLEEKKLLEKSEGALIVDLKKITNDEEIPPVIIKKSNGAILYHTTDLATIIQREKDFKPNKIIYVADKRQSLHFEQTFILAHFIDLISKDVSLIHIGFGTMNGSDGRPFKTRDGGVLKLSDLIDLVYQEAKKKIINQNYSKEQREEISKKVAMSALKFGDLMNHPSKDYIFDVDKFLSFEGKTGPYILYSISRINSILEKSNLKTFNNKKITKISTSEERDLILTIFKFDYYFNLALENNNPSYIAEYAYILSNVFNKFYSQINILNENSNILKEERLTLIFHVKEILILSCNLLGIKTLLRM